MNETESKRLGFLCRGQFVSADYFSDYYGLSWPLPDDVLPDFEQWRNSHQHCVATDSRQGSRLELERFMQHNDLIPKKWMAARLGMQVASLNALLDQLNELGMKRQRYVIYEDLIADSLREDLAARFPNLRLRTFGDHNSFCERHHQEIIDTLRIEVQPLFCATSTELNDEPKQYASSFDCITMKPLCVKHQLWLDFGKPLNLPPDRCSKLFYVKNREALRDYYAGSHEPDDLDQYQEFLAGQSSG